MTDNFIKLNKSNILRLGIKTDEGVDTGEYLEFDLEDTFNTSINLSLSFLQ